MSDARGRVSSWLRDLHPAWFSMVMATGIVSRAAAQEDIPGVPVVLLWLNVVFYGLLWVAYLARLVRYPSAHLSDLRSHARSMGYFTLPAASAVLGVQVLDIGGSLPAARDLWFLTSALWLVLVYAIPATLVTQPDKPSSEQGVTGAWLIWVVATQGTSVLGTRVASSFGSSADLVILATTAIWLVGGIFYLWVIQLIIRRLFFTPLDAIGLSPTYWIDMGAVAISTLAGATLLSSAGATPLVAELRPYIGGLTLLFWATATWWIPWLVVMGVWRHVVMRRSLGFEVGFWGVVFPLGMYTVATDVTGSALGLPALGAIASVFVWIALVAWFATLVDLVVTATRSSPGGSPSLAAR